MNYIIVDNNYLAHHGIKGQKWGIRRFQNEDGSLTSAGKQRYKEDARYAKSVKKDLDSYEKDAVKEVAEYNKADIKRNRYAQASMAYRERNNYAKADKYSKIAHQYDEIAKEHEKRVKEIDSKIWKKSAEAVSKGFDVTMEDITRRYRDKVAIGSTVAASILGGAGVAAATFFAPGGGTAAATGGAYGLYSGTKMANEASGHAQNILSKKYKVYKSAGDGLGQLKISQTMAIANATRSGLDEYIREIGEYKKDE